MPCWALNAMAEEAGQLSPDETGGALVGYEAEGGLVVTDLISAGPLAERSPAGFRPDAEYQLREIARLYEASGRIHTYIGDWHSHPDGSPTCSPVDRAALKEVARSLQARCPRPVMIILGEDDEPWEAVAWRYRPGRPWCRVDALAIESY